MLSPRWRTSLPPFTTAVLAALLSSPPPTPPQAPSSPAASAAPVVIDDTPVISRIQSISIPPTPAEPAEPAEPPEPAEPTPPTPPTTDTAAAAEPSAMTAYDAVAPVAAPAAESSSAADASPAKSSREPFDVVATYNRLLAEDADLTKPVAAIEALIDVLRQTTSSTTMETWEITGAQVARLHAAVPNSLPLEAGTNVFTNFLSMSMRQPATAANAVGSGGGLDSFDKIRQHLIDNSQLFAQRAKEARDRIAERGCRLVGHGDVVLTAGGSRAVRALLLKAADRLRASSSSSSSSSSSPPAPFTVLYVCDERSRDESDRAMAILRQHNITVYEIDPSAVAYTLEAHNVRSIFVGSEAVTHDGKLVSRIGTYQLAVLAQAARPPRNVYALAETHKFVRKLLLGNKDLARIGIRQGFVPTPVPTRAGVPISTKPALPYAEQVDVTPPNLVTNIITENGIIEPFSAYRVVSY